MFAVRVRSSKGQAVIDKLSNDTTFGQFKSIVQDKTGIAADAQKYKMGFPPKAALEDAKNEDTLATLKIKSGETLHVEEGAATASTTSIASIIKGTTTPDKYKDIPKLPNILGGLSEQLGKTGIFVQRQVPSDNSCMFASVAYGIEGAPSRKRTQGYLTMRSVIADFIQENKDRYNELVLGMSLAEYVQFIKKKEAWGGAIELSIFSEFYGIQICAWDIKSARMDMYGQDKDYKMRIFVIYDGIHYDGLALAATSTSAEEKDTTLFSVNDVQAVEKARVLVKDLQAKRKYTDLAGFNLRCLVCQAGLKGEKEAQQHAEQTGHTKFAEK